MTDAQKPEAAAPRRAPARRIAVVGAITAALFLGGGIGLGMRGDGQSDNQVQGVALNASALRDLGSSAAVSPTGAPGGNSIASLQRRLVEQPQDSAGWAALGSAYVQQARITLDPTYYPKAQGALERSLELRPTENLIALVGMGALANARHDFAGAVRWGRKATAVSSYNPDAYAVLTDAYTQLGRPAQATAAVQKMLDLSPALPALTRASYDLEQRGDRAGARRLMQRALDDAFTKSDIGFCRYYLGELAFSAGDLKDAAKQYAAGLEADPQSAPLLQGRAKVAALRGNTEAAARDYANLVTRVPNPQYVVEYGELLTKLGRTAEAKEQFAFVETLHQVFADNGGQDDLSLAEYEADHGSTARAVRYAKAEWDRRQSAVVAGAYAWALHQAGRDRAALAFSDKAVARGWRNALFFHHRAQIHRALGERSAAAADAAKVRQYNPAFDAELPSFGRPT